MALALAGCGGGSDESSNEQLIPRAVAVDLAAKSEAIADAYEAGDTCGAAGLADDLKDAVDAAVADGEIPPAFQGELVENATELQNDINCPPEPEKEEHGEDKGKGKKNGQTTTDTTTIGTTLDTTTTD